MYMFVYIQQILEYYISILKYKYTYIIINKRKVPTIIFDFECY